jgi:RNA polymerase sigma factor (sigma-70 family)
MQEADSGAPLGASSFESTVAKPNDEDPESRSLSNDGVLTPHPLDDGVAPDAPGPLLNPEARGNRTLGPMTCLQVSQNVGMEMFPKALADAMDAAPEDLFSHVFCEWLYYSFIYSELHTQVKRYYRDINTDEINGVINQAALRVSLHVEDGRPIHSVTAVLMTACKSIALDLRRYYQRQKREASLAPWEEPASHDDEDILATLARTDDRRLVTQLVGELRKEDAQIITLYYYEDLSCKEIAAVLGETPDVIKARLHRARQRLRELLEREGDFRED